MPDDINNNSGNIGADILSQLLNRVIQQSTSTDDSLKNIENYLKRMVGDSNRMSASNARNQGYTSDTRRYFQSPHDRQDPSNPRTFSKNVAETFADELFGKEFTQAFNRKLDEAFKENEKHAKEEFSNLSKKLGQEAFKQFTSTDWGKDIASTIREGAAKAMAQGGAFRQGASMPDISDELERSAQRTSATFSRMQRNANNASSSVSQFTNQVNSMGPMFEQAASALNLQQSVVSPLEDIASWMTGGSFDKFTGSVSDLPSMIASAISMAEGGGKKSKRKSKVDAVKLVKGLGKVGTAAEFVGSTMTTLGMTTGTLGTVAGTLTSVGGALGSLSGPIGWLAILSFKLNSILWKAIRAVEMWAAAPALEAFAKAVDVATDALARNNLTNKKNVELAKQRLEQDVQTLIEYPFQVMSRAADEWYRAWDANLRVITATQGYNKADVQALASAFSERLKKDGLSGVVASTDIINNLTGVLKSGLSGAAAEEFAYVATVLNNTIPTQDFFGYADEYASIVANLVNTGVSQEQAIQEATAQLTSFANNLLYASRATGGLTTGLKDAEGLFRQSVQISQTSKSNDVRNLSGLLTTVAAVTGALAPDLASSMTEAVYNAATGGNASNLVALRSLAGINASNTEFLKQLSNDPQKVFSTLFTNLAEMQSMSPDAFMEVAEGLADVFGIPMSALARIDFATLADAVKNFNVASDSLDQNLAMLRSGETTTSAEAMKIAKINEMILDEGLAYVLDNEAARAIQQHMWDEQLAREIQEAKYGVEIQGAALELIQGIASTVDRIVSILTLNIINIGANNLVSSIAEAGGQKKDIQNMLALGRVGHGNKTSYKNLTTYNQDLDLTDSLLSMMGGISFYESARTGRKAVNDILHLGMSTKNLVGLANWGSGLKDSVANFLTQTYYDTWGPLAPIGAILDKFDPQPAYTSKYTWGSIGKSSAAALGITALGDTSGMGTVASTVSATSAAQAKVTQNVERMIQDMQKYVDEEKSYNDYIRDAKKYGLSDVEKAMEEAGYSMSQVESQYKNLQAQNSVKEQIERQTKEVEFWDKNTSLLSTISDTLSDFLSKWEDYFINHTVYNSAYTRESVDKILQTERENSETAIYALADALTSNDVKLLLDPTVQTNALLSEILKVANAILNQQGTGGAGVSLPDTLAGLSLGLYSQ